MNADQKSFIEELRSLSEPVKRKMLFCAAVMSMIIVISLWLAYFNTIVPGAVPIAAASAHRQTIAQNANPGILGLFADAARFFLGVALDSAHGIISALKNSKQYNISPK